MTEGRKIVDSPEEAGVSGFRAIKKVRGLLSGFDIGSAPDGWTDAGEQAILDLDDTTILEMFGEAEAFELKEDKFRIYIPYKTQSSSTYMMCLVASARETGKQRVRDAIGEYITLERQDRVLGTTTKNGEKIEIHTTHDTGLPWASAWCFVSDETADSERVKDYVKALLIGKTEKVALRDLLTDTRAKQFPEFKAMLQAGTLAEELGLEIVEDKFAAKDV